MTFKADRRGIGRILKSEEMRAVLVAVAEKKKAVAEAIAPVDPAGHPPGEYKASFEVRSGIQHKKTTRAYASLVNTAPYAVYVEYGSRTVPAHHTLMKAVGS